MLEGPVQRRGSLRESSHCPPQMQENEASQKAVAETEGRLLFRAGTVIPCRLPMTRRTPEPWLLVAEKPGGAGDGHTHLSETRAMRRGLSGLESLLSSILLVWLPGLPSCHRAPGCPIEHQLLLTRAVPSYTTSCSVAGTLSPLPLPSTVSTYLCHPFSPSLFSLFSTLNPTS